LIPIVHRRSVSRVRAGRDDSRTPSDGEAGVARFVIATINGEWMNDWFAPDRMDGAAWRPTFVRDGVECDTEQAAGLLAGLIADLDADVVALQEAPSRAAELALFLDTHLAGRYRFLLGDSGGSQKLALLARTAVEAELVPPAGLAGLIEPWLADVDGDGLVNEYEFTRDPLVCRLTLDGNPLTIVVAHLKSNFINRGEQMWRDPARRIEFVRSALQNRRRIANEGMRMRQYLDASLDEDPDAAIVVLGDFNDGPGRDLFEQQYLAHNVTDLLVGSSYRPETLFGHALVDVPADLRYSAVFDDFVTEEPQKRILLDHIILSPAMASGAGVRKTPGSGRIEHDAWAARRVGTGERRDERATDHRPATVAVET
jgi:endonuclease/exonuclease/phosphatase family metal-dependent hydrolase